MEIRSVGKGSIIISYYSISLYQYILSYSILCSENKPASFSLQTLFSVWHI